MSADTLRKAAALMRERAEAALRGPWEALGSEHALGYFDVVQPADMDREIAARVWPSNAEHIASWHPAVALAVADWLDGVAWAIDSDDELAEPGFGEPTAAFAVARAYLGEAS